MPQGDGTGPQGQGPFTGRGAGRRGQGGTSECVCPKCGYSEPHKRGVPCTEKECPKCGTMMGGEYCQ